MLSAFAARRLSNVATAVESSDVVSDGLPAAEGSPAAAPRPLTEAQLASFIEDGFVALPVAELPLEWHTSFAQELFEHCFQGMGEPQPGTGLLQQERLTTLVSTPTVRGALSSVLGPDYVQYPNRALQSPAGSIPDQEVRTRDDKWHKDQCYVPVRHHRARWAIIFYYPRTVTRDMGGTGVLPGSAYATIDHDAREQDTLVDTCEDFLGNNKRIAEKKAHFRELAEQGAFVHGPIHGEPGKAGTTAEALSMIDGFEEQVATEGIGRATAELVDDLHARPAVRQAAEKECEQRWGVRMPRNGGNRCVYGPTNEEYDAPTSLSDTTPIAGAKNEAPVDKYMTMPKAGTIILTHYDTLHRGSPRLPKSLWRPMVRMKFFRVSEQPLVERIPRPMFASESAATPIWESLWNWYHGSSGATPTRPLPCALDVLNNSNDIERLAAAYTMASHARAGSDSAVAQLEELLVYDAQPVAQRAAMYGLAAAGLAAIPTLCSVLHTSTTAVEVEWVEGTVGEPLATATRAVFALGEAANPTLDVLNMLTELLERWLANLHACIKNPPAAVDGRPNPLAFWHRAVAICVQAVSLLAERATDENAILTIANVLLPLTVDVDPIGDRVPSSLIMTGSTCAGWWISEGAAIGLLRLVSSAATMASLDPRAVMDRGAVVKNTAPASQNDQRFVQALGMLALQRSLAALGPDAELTKLLSGAYNQWVDIYDSASEGAHQPTGWHQLA